MNGVILTNAHTHYEDIDYQPKRLKEEFEKLGVKIDILNNDFFPAFIYKDSIVNNLGKYDFCVYLDKDINTVRLLEKAGIKCFNNSDAIYHCDNKALTNIKLANNNILMPKTLMAPKIYNNEKILISLIENIEKLLEYPFVMKIAQSSQGMGVFLINNREELLQKIDQNRAKEIIFQEYIKNSFGQDVRVIVIDHKVVGAIKRQNKEDFRSNLTNGGSSIKFDVNEKLSKIACKITNILNLDYAGLDFLIDEDKYYLCEVNSNAFFKGFEKTSNINVAKIYAEYIIQKLTN